MVDRTGKIIAHNNTEETGSLVKDDDLDATLKRTIEKEQPFSQYTIIGDIPVYQYIAPFKGK